MSLTVFVHFIQLFTHTDVFTCYSSYKNSLGNYYHTYITTGGAEAERERIA